MSMHTLSHENLQICLELKVFESDIVYPVNTVMTVSVESFGFTGKSTMDIDIKSFSKFCLALSGIYTSLKGKAIIQEPYGHNQYLEFIGDGRGHIAIRGMIRGEEPYANRLEFENVIDQTFLRDFSNKLLTEFLVYLK